MLLATGVLRTSSSAGSSMLLACPPVMEERDDTRHQPARAPLPRLFAFPDPLELRFLASQCRSSAQLSVSIRAWFGALAIAAGCLFFALNTLSNRVRCAPLSPDGSLLSRACNSERRWGSCSICNT